MGRAEGLFARLESGGISAIDSLFANATNEEAFLEFKRSGNKGFTAQLHDDDRKNLAKALSGFSNTDGGVVVWGIGTVKRGDSATERQPVVDCVQFAGLIDGAVSGLTVPPVPGVRSIKIPIASSTSEGYVATLVPASLAGPHQLVDVKTYMMRAGSNFQAVGHTVLAGMFGRRPQAKIHINCVLSSARHVTDSQGLEMVEIWFDLHVSNDSAVVARDAYITIQAMNLGSENSNIANHMANDTRRWQSDASITPRLTSTLAVENNRVAPFSTQLAMSMNVQLVPPITQDIEISIRTGCDGAAPSLTNWHVPAAKLKSLMETHLEKDPQPNANKRIELSAAATMLGIAA